MNIQQIECANCGRKALLYPMDSGVPVRGTVEFDRWIQDAWPDASTQTTRFGFFLWCKPECERVWKETRLHLLKTTPSGAAHQHEMKMNDMRRKVG